ncbi:50S ribosomal protein L3 N(5)-glutamine methyltransferase [Candidatus Nardonella dryophthoridicola]|uniref:50S ribosomal protein L3 N(5)-glutamine methyltransferase n=1 Tax=endosymbiont of Metamasius hemipterus TaxID=204627 RepID=A0ABT0TWE2_9GAMM|nr:50S ribosomal protein L3 N(5)-glutamine methyltransferase [Candidatus Nardonella dryophthoridicola]MCM0158316.1 50S ribosomal protein L3 N(5)-glutamine methyltransferase [endosymbiont of Metamasius hemipterus]
MINNINKFSNILLYLYKKINNINIHCSPGFFNIKEELIYLIKNCLNLKFKNNINNILISKENINKIISLFNIRIKKRIPIQYILNKSLYYGLNIFINKNVIIPRSSIGEFIKNKKINKIIKKYPKKILELCTGSGCISILLSKLYKKSKIEASDLYNKVLKITNINIKKYKIKNIKVIKSNLFKNINNKYNLIITNPPYVNLNNFKKLPKEYKYEPYNSLYGGIDGLKFINKILKESYNYLEKNGILICEVGNNYKLLIKKYPNIKFNWIKTKNKQNKIFFIKKEKINLINK